MQTIDFSPFYRSTVGFDRLFNRLDTLSGQALGSRPLHEGEVARVIDDTLGIRIFQIHPNGQHIVSHRPLLPVQSKRSGASRRSREAGNATPKCR